MSSTHSRPSPSLLPPPPPSFLLAAPVSSVNSPATVGAPLPLSSSSSSPACPSGPVREQRKGTVSAGSEPSFNLQDQLNSQLQQRFFLSPRSSAPNGALSSSGIAGDTHPLFRSPPPPPPPKPLPKPLPESSTALTTSAAAAKEAVAGSSDIPRRRMTVGRGGLASLQLPPSSNSHLPSSVFSSAVPNRIGERSDQFSSRATLSIGQPHSFAPPVPVPVPVPVPSPTGKELKGYRSSTIDMKVNEAEIPFHPEDDIQPLEVPTKARGASLSFVRSFPFHFIYDPFSSRRSFGTEPPSHYQTRFPCENGQ